MGQFATPCASTVLRARTHRVAHRTRRRAREYLTPAKVRQLVQAARTRGRYGARDAATILIAYRHGLRMVELGLRWDQVDFGADLLHVNRVKRGTPSVHPLHGPELRALCTLCRETARLRSS